MTEEPGVRRRRGRPPMSAHDRTEQRLHISREAVRLYREQGLAATSVEQIAERAGLSVRTIWRYFRTKESCVEPLLSILTGEFVAVLRRWPPRVALDRHLLDERLWTAGLARADRDAALDVVTLTRTDAGLRAVWLVVFELTEPVLAEVLAVRLARSPGDLTVRVWATAIAGALRTTVEDAAAVHADGADEPPEESAARLARALDALNLGAVGGGLPGSWPEPDADPDHRSAVAAEGS